MTTPADPPLTPHSYSDRDLATLDDGEDREELRRRYYGLLQELRVIIPGVQVLLAFLLTAPFAQRFTELDRMGRVTFGVALFSALVSVICLLTPALLHRVGERTARRARLQWSVRLTVAGMAALGVAVISALWSVARVVYSTPTATALVASASVVIGLLWIGLPLAIPRSTEAPPPD